VPDAQSQSIVPEFQSHPHHRGAVLSGQMITPPTWKSPMIVRGARDAKISGANGSPKNRGRSGCREEPRNQGSASDNRSFSASGDSVCDWPDFVRSFFESPQERTRFAVSNTPPSFQPPDFDCLNQSREEWAKKADTAWKQFRDRFSKGARP
jgi:hypothetical protein